MRTINIIAPLALFIALLGSSLSIAAAQQNSASNEGKSYALSAGSASIEPGERDAQPVARQLGPRSKSRTVWSWTDPEREIVEYAAPQDREEEGRSMRRGPRPRGRVGWTYPNPEIAKAEQSEPTEREERQSVRRGPRPQR